jgi:aspartate racemase
MIAETRLTDVAPELGTRLATDLCLPARPPAPAIAGRTPYGREKHHDQFGALARRGYVAPSQDCRGAGDSEPDPWNFHVHEREDSLDGAGDRPVVGILGGMGPAAGADFLTRLTAATPATADHEHLRVLLWSDPRVPDRSAALLAGGPDPTEWLLRGARMLADGGADLLTVPCNTAHAFLGPIEERVGIEIVHMIEATASHIARRAPAVRRAGLLATTGTIHARLFDGWLTRHGIDAVVPTSVEQERVAAVIRAVKAGSRSPVLTRALAEVADRLVARGAEVVIAGCTEIPLVFAAGDASVPVIDTIAVLVDAVIAAAIGTDRDHGTTGENAEGQPAR